MGTVVNSGAQGSAEPSVRHASTSAQTSKTAPSLPAALIVGPNDVRRRYMETARDDHDVILDPGPYPLRYSTVNFYPCAPSEAYWACASIPCTRIRDGARFGKAGDRSTYHFQTQTYTLEAK